MNEGLNLLISDLGLPDTIGRDSRNEFQKKFGPAGIALAGHGTENDVAQSSIRGFLTHLKKPAHVKLSAWVQFQNLTRIFYSFDLRDFRRLVHLGFFITDAEPEPGF